MGKRMETTSGFLVLVSSLVGKEGIDSQSNSIPKKNIHASHPEVLPESPPSTM